MRSESYTIKREREIDPNKQYVYPENISVIHYKSHIIIVAIDTANWIILSNEKQFEFFNLLKVYKLSDAIAHFDGVISDAQNVIIQLEAKNFENAEVKSQNSVSYLHLHLTNSCNMRCPHCYMFAGAKEENELTTPEIFELLFNFKKNNGVQVTLSGGEICTHHDLYEIIKFAYDLGLRVDLLTNGTLWNDDLIKKISPLVYRVQISLDGFSEEENAKVRGRGNFTKALETVDKFVNSDVNTEVAMTPFFDSSLEFKYKDYVNFGKQLIEKYQGFKFNIKFTLNLLDGREMQFDEDERNKYFRISEKIYVECLGDVLDLPFINLHKEYGIEDNCDFGNLTVASDGNVYFCPSLSSSKPFANLRIDSFDSIIKISEQAKVLSKVDNLRPCRDCELKYICGGDCRIKYFDGFQNLDVKNRIDTPIRQCNENVKYKIYDLMIRTNRKLFK